MRAVEEKVPFEEILASNVTDVFSIDKETFEEAGGSHEVSEDNVAKGNTEMKQYLGSNK